MSAKHAVPRSTRAHSPVRWLVYAWLSAAPSVFLLTVARIV